MRWSAAVLLVAAFGLFASRCSDVDVLVPDERAALERFESIANGAHEDELRAKLGPPTCIVTLERPDAPSIVAHCPADGAPVVLSREQQRDWPWPVWTLPDDIPTRRVLIYADGTVFARYFVDDDGKVVSTLVSVS